MQIFPLLDKFLSPAAALFIQNYKKQRLLTPLLPDTLEDQEYVERMLGKAFGPSSGLVAVEDGVLAGFLCWYLIDNFRDTGQKAAYVPEWGHARLDDQKSGIYRSLYRQAGEIWAASGCRVHAITLLAHDLLAEKAWYWNGFGLAVVDAIRAVQPLGLPQRGDFTIRKAVLSDAAALTALDAEHFQHYARSPVFMPPRAGINFSENLEFLSRSKNSVWLAEEHGSQVGFIRFEGYSFETAAILESENAVAITGAYVRPAYRGKKLAASLLDAALRDYLSMGLDYCAVDFESFNPEASAFWMKYFQPVCYSLMRVPESFLY